MTQQYPVDDLTEHELAERERHLQTLRQALNDREQATQQLRVSLEENELTMNALRESIEEQERALEAMRASFVQRDQEIASLQQRVSDQQTDTDYKVALALTLANAAYDVLMVLDCDGRVLATNTSAELLFADAHPAGKTLLEVTHEPTLDSIVQDALANQEEQLEEQIVIDKRMYRVRVQAVDRSGHSFVALALQDVTELVRLNRARRDMVANISHELRTPIANIRVIIESLFHEQEKPKRKQSTSALRAIARETDSLLWLVQELLDLSMIESGQAILRMIEFPLPELVDDAIERMEDQSEAKDIRIESEVPAGIAVLADRDQARRVLINLIHNAIKWSPAGGKITVRAENRDEEVLISVVDNGPGVPEEFRDRIFERFYQIDASRSGGEGTGLGLAICRHIVEAHGGKIWVDDTPGAAGGRFLFTLPKADEPVKG